MTSGFVYAVPMGTGGGGTLADGDYGSVTVSGGGTIISIDPNAVDTPEIADEAVTLAKLELFPDLSIIAGETTGGPFTPTFVSAGGASLVLRVNDAGTDIEFDTINAPSIANNAVTTAKILNGNVTYAKIQDASAESVLLGRGEGAGVGDVQEIALGDDLYMIGQTLHVNLQAMGRWSFDTSTTMADPGTGDVRFNNATGSSVTQMAIAALSDFDVDGTLFFQTMVAGDAVLIQDRDDATKWIRFTLSAAPTNNTTWFLFPVIYVSSAGALPANNDGLLVVISGGGGTSSGLSDGDYGDITVSSAGSVMTIDTAAIDVISASTLADLDTDTEGLYTAAQGASSGDILYHNGAAWARLPIGGEGDVLTIVSGVPAWV